MRIEASRQEILERDKLITKFLKPIINGNLYATPISRPEEHIWTVKDNSSKPLVSYPEVRFKTIASDLRANYYEIWKRIYKSKSKSKEVFYLERAYLHIYLIEPGSNQEKEFLLLHCDPNEPDNAAHAKYKQSLHLHIECVSAPWPHCDIWPHAHIALNTGYLDYVLKDINSLTEAIEHAVVMLKEEVLDQFKD